MDIPSRCPECRGEGHYVRGLQAGDVVRLEVRHDAVRSIVEHLLSLVEDEDPVARLEGDVEIVCHQEDTVPLSLQSAEKLHQLFF